MESKTIRFEKGKQYDLGHHDLIPDETMKKHFKPFFKASVYTCTKSFTVQINIIEDEQPVTKDTCPHPDWGTDGGGDYCKKCGYRL